MAEAKRPQPSKTTTTRPILARSSGLNSGRSRSGRRSAPGFFPA